MRTVTSMLVGSSLVAMMALAVNPANASWFDNFDSYTAGTPLDTFNSNWDVFDGQTGGSPPTTAGIQPVTAQSLSASNSIQGSQAGQRGAMFRAADAGDDTLYFSLRFGTPGSPGSTVEVGMTQATTANPIFKNLIGGTAWVGIEIDSRAGSPLDTFQFWAMNAAGGVVAGSVWDLDGQVPDLTQDTWYDFRIILNANDTADYAYKASSSSTWIEDNGNPVTPGLAFNHVGVTASNGTSQVYVDNVGTIPIPEPASLALLGLGGMLMVRRRRR